MTLDFLGAITGIFVIVQDGQHALRFTLGRARKVVGPGIHFKIPLLQTFAVRDTKHTTLDLEPQVIQLQDDLVYEVDCKLLYQIVNLRKALIEVDELVPALKNRVVMAVQHVVASQDRESVREVDDMSEAIREDLRAVEDQWGIRIIKFGFSNISPSPATLEITQLELLAHEKLRLYGEMRESQLGEDSAVALLSGAVVSLTAEEEMPTAQARRRLLEAQSEAIEEELEAEDGRPRPAREEPGDLAEDDDDEEEL